MPIPDPITSLRQVATDIDRFADELERATDLDARVLRYWHTRLLEIAADLERTPTQSRTSAGPASD